MRSRITSELIVVVSGGGPVGLTFSLNLAMMMCKKHMKIIIYEGRWFVDENGVIHWRDEKQGNIRRNQVVTLQDHVIQQLPIYVQEGLFERINERVWPTSRNIPIREVEDRLLALIQPFVQSGQVELIPEPLNELSEQLIKGDFDLLVGADGSNSFVRRYCNIQMMSEGIEYACGVAYDIPADVSPADEPLHQALNCILTSSQTRYLVNSSESRRGYLNIRLTRREYEELRAYLQMFQNSREPIVLADFKQYAQPSVWCIIQQGLDFFNIRPQFVFHIVPIEINVRHASVVIRELCFQVDETQEMSTSLLIERTDDGNYKKFKTMLACLIGDAAMGVHFWAGRGMNSGMKSAMALARNIFRSCLTGMPPHFDDLADYENFMTRLRVREELGRSLRILTNPIDKSVEEAYRYGSQTYYLTRCAYELKAKLRETRQTLEVQPDWPHKSRPVTDEELDDICTRISQEAIAQLSLANPWSTPEISDAEVLVEDTFPFIQNHFLSVPQTSKVTASGVDTNIVHRHHRFLVLWIVGDQFHDDTMELIDLIRTSSKFAHSPSTAKQTESQSYSSSDEVDHRLYVVSTIKEAKEWLRTARNRENIRRKNTHFKVVTAWSLDEKHTAVDVIRAVRAETSHAPILVIPNRYEDTRLVYEYPNVMIMDTLFDLYEFLETNQATQWDGGYRVSHPKKETRKSAKNLSFSHNNGSVYPTIGFY